MTVSVVMSSATRVPEMSLLLSTLLRQPTTYRGPLLALTMTARGAQPHESTGAIRSYLAAAATYTTGALLASTTAPCSAHRPGWSKNV